MDDAITRYQAASEAGDIDGIMATMASDVEVISPLSGRMVFRGQADVRILFALLLGPKVARHPGVVRRALAG